MTTAEATYINVMRKLTSNTGIAVIAKALAEERLKALDEAARKASEWCFCETVFPGCDPCRIETAIRALASVEPVAGNAEGEKK